MPKRRPRPSLNFETALAKASMDRVARRNPDNTYHKMTVDEFASADARFRLEILRREFGIPPIESLNVGAPDFVKSLDTTIADTSLADLKTYMKWQLLDAAADSCRAPFDEEDFRFNGKILRGTEEMPARWKRCVQATDRALGEALGQKFVEVAFNGASKKKALQLVGEIEKEMRTDIKNAIWMTPPRRTRLSPS